MTENGSKQAQRRRETRRRLLAAALAVFGQRGYEAATVDDIVAAAGYSKGAFYFHFPTKEDIFLELLRSHLIVGEGLPFAEAGLQEADTLQQQVGPLLMEFWAHAARNAPVREGLAKLYEARRQHLLQTLDPATRDKQLATELTCLLIALEDGLLVQEVVDPHRPRGDRLALLQRLLHAFTLSFDEPAGAMSVDTALKDKW